MPPRLSRTATGRVVSTDEDSAVLDVDGSRRQVGFADVTKARVEIEFNRPKTAGPRGATHAPSEEG